MKPGRGEIGRGSGAAQFTLELLRGRWKLYLLFELRPGPRRTGELLRALPGISKNRLNATLRDLERTGFVRRKSYPGRVPRVEYALTALGASLCPVVEALHEWGARNEARVRRMLAGRRGAR